MIRHTILFKVKPEVSEDTVNAAIENMRSFESELRGVFSIIGGECEFHDEKSVNFFMQEISRGASHCISIDFFDRKALDDFFNNPSLSDAKNAIIQIAEGGYEGIVAFDLQNPDI